MRALLLLLLLLMPVAGACSMSGPIPGPAKITLVPNDGGEEIVVAVDGRMSGGMCEMSNPHAFDGRTFAWLEYSFDPRGHEVHLLDLDSREERVVELGPDAEQFGLWNGSVISRARTFSGEGHSLLAHDTFHLRRAGGAAELLPFPEGTYSSAAFGGPLVAAVRRESPQNASFYLYDLASGTWRAHGIPAKELVNDTELSVGPMGDGWLYLHARQWPLLYDTETGEHDRVDRTVPPSRWPAVQHPRAIVEGYAWSWEAWAGQATRARLPDGKAESVPISNLTLGVIPGYTVLGDYSAPELNPWYRPWWLPQYGPWIATGAVVLALLAGVVFLRRRRA